MRCCVYEICWLMEKLEKGNNSKHDIGHADANGAELI
jgi:hypothetical protein